ncbi:unnamed protein product [Arctia plantaginis]|uniref:Uncharacterized protein n=1 Tax=Arctia plantaginis TaxID=874455 RepID=A0A8S1AWI4_ARCPL|nr:unnamed protein product [Arctia plantaginis]
MATLDHYWSTDQLPRHNKCPEGVENWCEWRKAEATNTLAAFKYPPRLIDEHVEKHIRLVYEELSKDDLLMRESTRSASPDKTGAIHFEVKRPEQPADSNIRAKTSFLKSLKGNSMDQESLISLLLRWKLQPASTRRTTHARSRRLGEMLVPGIT